ASVGWYWGAPPADTDMVMVYVITQDWPSVYKLSLEQPPIVGGGGGAAFEGRNTYEQNCQSCHGANRTGSQSAPSLATLAGRINLEDFRQVVAAGKGKMPAFPNLD